VILAALDPETIALGVAALTAAAGGALLACRFRQRAAASERELAALRGDTAEFDRLKRELLANMSHEVRTPLHAILSLSRILLDETSGPLTAEQRKQVGIIERNGHNLLEMLDDIIDYSKIEAGRMRATMEVVWPASVLAGVREVAAPLARDKGLDLVFRCPDQLPSVRTDRAKLQRIVEVFTHNALKFTAAGSISLVGETTPEGVKLEVRDTGPGIAEDDQELIFEPFRQVDGSTSRSAGGTGLGLAIARHLARMVGARLTIESRIGEGSAFAVILPHEEDA